MKVSISNLSKKFTTKHVFSIKRPFVTDTKNVLSNINLEVKSGEVIGIIGHNGAGKSTLLKTVAGLIKPDEGEIRLDGALIWKNRLGYQVCSYVPSDERIHYYRLTAEKNLAFFAELQGVSRASQNSEISRVLDLVGLEGSRQVEVRLFSSGMRQRLIIARSLLNNPQVFLFDEPTRSLDEEHCQWFTNFVRKKLARKGKTVICATHDLDRAIGFCDRFLLFEAGRIKSIWLTEEIMQRLLESKSSTLELKNTDLHTLTKICKHFELKTPKLDPKTGNLLLRLEQNRFQILVPLMEAISEKGGSVTHLYPNKNDFQELIQTNLKNND